jgi:hypothetical protein
LWKFFCTIVGDFFGIILGGILLEGIPLGGVFLEKFFGGILLEEFFERNSSLFTFL